MTRNVGRRWRGISLWVKPPGMLRYPGSSRMRLWRPEGTRRWLEPIHAPLPTGTSGRRLGALRAMPLDDRRRGHRTRRADDAWASRTRAALARRRRRRRRVRDAVHLVGGPRADLPAAGRGEPRRLCPRAEPWSVAN